VTASNFPSCLAFTLGEEGGYSDMPGDPGGPTNRGITLETYIDWLGRPVSTEQLAAMPEVIAGKIYESNYWRAVNGDMLPTGVDLMVFDFGVTSGPGTSAKRLQGFLQVRQDGQIGPETLGALKAYDAPTVIKWLGASQQTYYRQLGQEQFLAGWLARTARRTSAALGMAA